MDFPVTLDKQPTWVYSIAELAQVVEILLKNPAGSFIQSRTLGALFSLHSPSESITLDIRRTLETIPGITVETVSIVNSDVTVIITYRGEVIKYQYTLVV